MEMQSPNEFLQKQEANAVPQNKETPTEDFLSFCGRFERFAPITHKAFGRGTVLSKDGTMILVKFESGKTKTLSLSVLYEKSLTE